MSLSLFAIFLAAQSPGTAAVDDKVRAALPVIDRNGDRAVSRDEFRRLNELLFDRADRNRNDRLDETEALVDGLVAPLPEVLGLALASHGSAASKLTIDANRDGIVTQEEYLAPGKGSFATLDRDKSGTLDQNEFMEIPLVKELLDQGTGSRELIGPDRNLAPPR